MMKKIVFLLCFITGLVHAQHNYFWEGYSIEFSSPEALDLYNDEADPDFFGGDSDNYAVEIIREDLDENKKFFGNKDIKTIAFEEAELFTFKNTKDGGKLPNFSNGYYVITHDLDDDPELSATVVVVVIMDSEKNDYFVSTIYCYNKNKAAGVKIAKSFAFRNQ